MTAELAEICVEELGGELRPAEAIRIGVPLRKGALFDLTTLEVRDQSDVSILSQSAISARWSDGSAKWLLVDAVLAMDPFERRVMRLVARSASESREASPSPPVSPLRVVEGEADISVETGPLRLTVSRDRFACMTRADSHDSSLLEGGEFTLRDASGRQVPIRHLQTQVESRGDVGVTVLSRGEVVDSRSGCCLELECRFSLSAYSALVRVDILIRNPRAALHPGGLWDLGDAGSVAINDAAFELRPAGTVASLLLSCDDQAPASEHDAEPLLIHQNSSGGRNWNCKNHVSADDRLTVSFCGYQVRAGAGAGQRVIDQGARATPVLALRSDRGWIASSILGFWQNFPKSLRWSQGKLTAGIFPRESGLPVELQGGEQKRHTVLLEFGLRDVAPTIHCQHRPLSVTLGTAAVEQSKAIAYFTSQANDPNSNYLEYIRHIVEGERSFFCRRELIDEYGWRNFGDLYADHEAVGHPGAEPFVSHYNNQYDFIYGALVHHLRSAHRAWGTLAADAARHAVDIDIYHTNVDRPAFNGGLFWHTDHHLEAQTSTHRTYSRRNSKGASYGGGPSNEHNYSSGLLLFHYLTGDVEAKRAVSGLADWVIAMDDGTQTFWSWANERPTGLASKTVDEAFHKPGRGAGNSINCLLDAYCATESRHYLDKAEELVARCIHPDDDVVSLGLGEPEYRWSYLVFLQALGKYLATKTELGEFDYRFYFARDGLLNYANWMLQHEVPYKDVMHKVKLPTETWSAQDIRKCHIFHLAAKYSKPADREQFVRKAGFFFERCLEDVLSFQTALLTRPLVILAVYGPIHAFFVRHGYDEDLDERVWTAHRHHFGMPNTFVTQRECVGTALRSKSQIAIAEVRRRSRDVWHEVQRRFLRRKQS